jgi:hypothetical protein
MQTPHTFQYPARVVPVLPTNRSEKPAKPVDSQSRPAAPGTAPNARRS